MLSCKRKTKNQTKKTIQHPQFVLSTKWNGFDVFDFVLVSLDPFFSLVHFVWKWNCNVAYFGRRKQQQIQLHWIQPNVCSIDSILSVVDFIGTYMNVCRVSFVFVHHLMLLQALCNEIEKKYLSLIKLGLAIKLKLGNEFSNWKPFSTTLEIRMIVCICENGSDERWAKSARCTKMITVDGPSE